MSSQQQSIDASEDETRVLSLSSSFRRRRRGGSIASMTSAGSQSQAQEGNRSEEEEEEEEHHNDEDEDDRQQWEFLMRHSSPILTARMPSPLTERNTSPSPIHLTRPRSNPRNRTPMRYQSPLVAAGPDGTFGGIPEEPHVGATTEGQRITIRPTAGRAVGTALRSTHQYAREGDLVRPAPVVVKSRKQGPSHRKVRRWNNSNFVNLAAEVGTGKASEALLIGHAEAEKYLEITDPSLHMSRAMERLRSEEGLKSLREGFFAGDIHARPAPTPSSHRQQDPPVNGQLFTPDEMLFRIESRLRKVIFKACENSYPASQVINKFEIFAKAAHRGKSTSPNKLKLEEAWWADLLMEPPSVTYQKKDDVYITRCLFDGDSPNAGFHRLLLHGLCQFHGLKAISSTMEVTVQNRQVQSRLLTAIGRISDEYKKVQLTEAIAQRGTASKVSRTKTHGTAEAMQSIGNQMAELNVVT